MAYSRHGLLYGMRSFLAVAVFIASSFIPITVSYAETDGLRMYSIDVHASYLKDAIEVEPFQIVQSSDEPEPELFIDPAHPEYRLAMITGHSSPFDHYVAYPLKE